MKSFLPDPMLDNGLDDSAGDLGAICIFPDGCTRTLPVTGGTKRGATLNCMQPPAIGTNLTLIFLDSDQSQLLPPVKARVIGARLDPDQPDRCGFEVVFGKMDEEAGAALALCLARCSPSQRRHSVQVWHGHPEKREYPRVPMQLAALVDLPGGSLQLETKNLSLSGALLAIPERPLIAGLEAGRKVEVRFSMPGVPSGAPIKATVRRVAEGEESTDIGLEFTEVSQEAAGELEVLLLGASHGVFQDASASALIELERQTSLQLAVARASVRLAGTRALDDAVGLSLAEMGSLCRADRVYLFLLRDCGTEMDNTHEWCAPDTVPRKARRQNISTSIIPAWLGQQLRSYGKISIQDMASLPDEASAGREFLKAQDIKSLLVFPVSSAGSLVGFLGIDNVKDRRAWSPNDQAMLSVVSDIISRSIERQIAARKIALIDAQLKQACCLESIGRLAGGIAHDFNNMLSIMLSYTQMVRDTLPGGDPRIADLDEAIDAGKRAAQFVSQLLRFSRREPPAVKAIDLNDHTRCIHRLLGKTLGKQFDLQLQQGRNLPSIQADPGQIDQVIMNLVLNARDATPDGGKICIETGLVSIDAADAHHHSELTPGKWVRLAVKDTGPGMDQDVVDKIFEPFFSTKQPGKGTGLGLATVYGVVTQTRGHIKVDTAPGEGSTFTIWFPAQQEPAGTFHPDNTASRATSGPPDAPHSPKAEMLS